MSDETVQIALCSSARGAGSPPACGVISHGVSLLTHYWCFSELARAIGSIELKQLVSQSEEERS